MSMNFKGDLVGEFFQYGWSLRQKMESLVTLWSLNKDWMFFEWDGKGGQGMNQL